MARSKYRAVRTEVDGITFASKKEALVYSSIKLAEKCGLISDVELQPKFPIVVAGKKICTYIADFRYFSIEKNRTIIEDVKGMKTAVYRIKKKLVEALYGIEITEV